jgi:hypothetical protein
LSTRLKVVYQVGVSEVTRDPRFKKLIFRIPFFQALHPYFFKVWRASKILMMERGNPLTPIRSVTCQKITCLKSSAVKISYLATLLTPI